MSDRDFEELDGLLLDHREGELTAAGRERLQDLLRSSPEARVAFAQIQLTDTALHLLHAEGGVPPQLATPVRQLRTAHNVWLAVAAAIVLVGIGVWFGRGGRDAESETAAVVLPTADATLLTVATATTVVEVEWLSEMAPRQGHGVGPGRLALASGSLQLGFYRGAKLLVEGPAELVIESANRIICRQGVIRAQVPPQARGFTVVSPTTELVDLGTEFAMRVSAAGVSEVHVFEGLVELYPANQDRPEAGRRELSTGKSLRIGADGRAEAFAAEVNGYPSFARLHQRALAIDAVRFEDWRDWSAATAVAPTVVAHYDFEGEGQWLSANRPGQGFLDGAVIGCERASGRWPQKGGLAFARAGDRVRVEIPGTFDQLTLSAWVRVDSLKKTFQALLLTDGFETGECHWQISNAGELRFGVRGPDRRPPNDVYVVDYSVANVIGPGRLGVWSHLCTTYDREAGVVRHYLDGHQVGELAIEVDIPLTLGAAEIGNWGVPIHPDSPYAIRNFSGRIDELTIRRVALSAEDVRQIYEIGRP